MSKPQQTILITPLNWGLGHATRCIPIIRALQKIGHRVIIASDGRALFLLQKEFPKLTTLQLPAYKVHYASQNMFLNLIPQVPKIFLAIFRERQVIKKIVKEYKISAIISDNRFGCHDPTIPSIFMTHQVNIKIPVRFLEKLVGVLNRAYIRSFDACWIPDMEGEKNLAGSLAHGFKLKNTNYIGILSRMKKLDLPQKWDLIVILSGPEPQRTYLEEAVLKQLENLTLKTLVIKGKTDEEAHFNFNENTTVKSYMTSEELNRAICESKVVLTRSGYTTLMDLAFLGKTAILIPTPGQTEQEYLAKHFHEKRIFLSQSQNELDIYGALKEIPYFTGLNILNPDSYQERKTPQF